MNPEPETAPAGAAGSWEAEDRRGPGAPEESDLARILAAESRLESSLADERRRAEAAIESAREQARTVRRAEAARLEEELVDMRERIRDEHRESVEEIRRRAERRARRYRGTSEETVERLARAVVGRLVEESP